MKTWIIRNKLILLCLLGTIVRCVYGYVYTPWMQAPDQLAWEIAIGEEGWSYAQLIHYPHEGGTLLLGAVGKLIGSVCSFHVLTIVAVMADFASRYVQIVLTKKMVGDKLALLFACWTVCATPAILPWSTVNFGLHSLSSFFPFVLLYILKSNRIEPRQQLIHGLFLGVAVWFSYSNLLLIPVYFCVQLFRHRKMRNWGYALLSVSGILILHAIVRMSADSGFHLEQMGVFSIRGEQFTQPESWKALYQVWGQVLSDASFAVPRSPYYFSWVSYVWLFLAVTGMLVGLYVRKSGAERMMVTVGWCFVFVFVLIYALSPFYYDRETPGSYVSYRHLTYIFPVLSFLILYGLSKVSRVAPVLTGGVLAVGVYGAFLRFTEPVTDADPSYAVGWVLAKKWGHNPQLLTTWVERSTYDHRHLIQGIGWGTGTALFMDVSDTSDRSNEAITKWLMLVNKYPVQYRKELMEGFQYAFSDQVTPRLDPNILKKIPEKTEDKTGY